MNYPCEGCIATHKESEESMNKIFNCDCLAGMYQLEDGSIDLIVTDPPYGLKFMGKNWDKAVPSVNIWKECWRVLKSGAFAFVMCIPRQDCLSRMVLNLEEAGFDISFTPIYWAYATGFPKSLNISKAVDKKFGVERDEFYIREDFHKRSNNIAQPQSQVPCGEKGVYSISATPQAKALDGAYGGFQPKPAVEVIIVAMKPLSEKTFTDQALTNRKGCTWLDSCRIPYDSERDKESARFRAQTDIRGANYGTNRPSDGHILNTKVLSSSTGRFPANLLVSDDVLDDGRETTSTGGNQYNRSGRAIFGKEEIETCCPGGYGDSGSFSRYFDLDKWAQKTFPFLIVPKASKREKNKGLDGFDEEEVYRAGHGNQEDDDVTERFRTQTKNIHPTCKPIKLMSYLITLGSREGDLILDPFIGSGTTACACKLLRRRYIGFELNEEYHKIAEARVRAIPKPPEKLSKF